MQYEEIQFIKQFNERLPPDRRYEEDIKTPSIVRKNK